MRSPVVVGRRWGGFGGVLWGVIPAMLCWVRWAHRPNMCGAFVWCCGDHR